MDSINMKNSPGLVSESCHESTFKLIRHHNFNDVLFSQNVKKRGIFSIEKIMGLSIGVPPYLYL
jgi:hypothetical protein